MNTSAGPEIFETIIPVHKNDIDALGHVNNVVYVRWVQEIAGAHWNAIATPNEKERYRWVVLRHEIDYLKPVFRNDKITGHTWVESMAGVKSIRRVEIRRGAETVLSALTSWCLLDAQSLRPTRIPEKMSRKFIS